MVHESPLDVRQILGNFADEFIEKCYTILMTSVMVCVSHFL